MYLEERFLQENDGKQSWNTVNDPYKTKDKSTIEGIKVEHKIV